MFCFISGDSHGLIMVLCWIMPMDDWIGGLLGLLDNHGNMMRISWKYGIVRTQDFEWFCWEKLDKKPWFLPLNKGKHVEKSLYFFPSTNPVMDGLCQKTKNNMHDFGIALFWDTSKWVIPS